MSIVNIEALKNLNCQLWWPGSYGSANAPKAITAYGNVTQYTSEHNGVTPPVNGGGMAYFDGNGDYLNTGTSITDFQFGTNDFTIVFYYKRAALGSTGYVFCQIVSSSVTKDCLGFRLTGDTTANAYFYGSDNAYHSIVGITIPNDTNWHCIWMGRITIINSFLCYVDGVYTKGIEIGSSIGLKTATGRITIGCEYLESSSTAQTFFNGYVSEFAVFNRLLSSTVPPTQPFTPDPYTKLLLHMDGTGAAFYDSSDPPGDNGFPILPAGVTITPTGTFTSIKGKDSRNYWKFDGSTNYVSLSDNAAWAFGNGDFTICCWIRIPQRDDENYGNVIISTKTSTWSASSGWELADYVKDSPYPSVLYFRGTETYDNTAMSSTEISTGNWIFICVIRSSNIVYQYLNIVLDYSRSCTANITGGTLRIAQDGSLNAGRYFKSNIKDLMIFKGRALSVDQIAAIMAETYIY